MFFALCTWKNEGTEKNTMNNDDLKNWRFFFYYNLIFQREYFLTLLIVDSIKLGQLGGCPQIV